MAVANVMGYLDRLKNKKSPVITAGQGKAQSSGGPGLVGNTPKNPGPAATMVSPEQGKGSVITAGYEKGSQKTPQYLTDYEYRSFSPSGRTEDYYDKLQGLEANAPGDFQSRYQEDIDKIISGIMGRPKFETDDVYKSDLYKTLREQYINQGQKAMRDTIGSATAMTGGYGSTYAQAAGQQAYDGYLSQFSDKTLDIYDRVYNQYLQEGQEMYNQLSMLNGQDAIDYGRYRDTVADYQADRDYYAGRYDSSYNQDFGEYTTEMGAKQWAEQYAYQKTQDALAQQNWQAQMDYQKQQDAQAQANWQTEFDYQKEQDAKQMALAYARARSGGSGGGSGKGSSGSKQDSKAGYAPIAAGIIEKVEKNNWNNQQAYEYVMQLGEQGKINLEQVDDILKAAGIDETKALKQQQKVKELEDDFRMGNPYLYLNTKRGL